MITSLELLFDALDAVVEDGKLENEEYLNLLKREINTFKKIDNFYLVEQRNLENLELTEKQIEKVFEYIKGHLNEMERDSFDTILQWRQDK